MSSTTRWIIAALLFVLLAILAIYANLADLPGFRGASLIESRIQSQADAILQASETNGAGAVSATADGQKIVLSGTLPNETAREAMIGEVRRAIGPGGVVVGGVTVVRHDLKISDTQSPYILDARYNEGEIRLTGFVPDEAARTAIEERARTLFASSRVINELQIANGAPGGVDWLAAANWGLERLARLDEGALSMADRELSLRGRTGLEAVSGDIEADFASGAPENMNATQDITLSPAAIIVDDAEPAVVDPEPQPAPQPAPVIENRDECQTLFNTLMANNEIRFAFNSADIDAVSVPLLEQLAGAARQCQRFAIRIEGHTDAVGADDVNQMLSDLRAKNVADFIASRDVDASRLTAVGFGENQPIATNATREGRARNRRIVFVISE